MVGVRPRPLNLFFVGLMISKQCKCEHASSATVSSARFGSTRFGSTRFGSTRFGTIPFGTVRCGSVVRLSCLFTHPPDDQEKRGGGRGELPFNAVQQEALQAGTPRFRSKRNAWRGREGVDSECHGSNNAEENTEQGGNVTSSS